MKQNRIELKFGREQKVILTNDRKGEQNALLLSKSSYACGQGEEIKFSPEKNPC